MPDFALALGDEQLMEQNRNWATKLYMEVKVVAPIHAIL
jgi:hypothetical protein